MANKFAVFSSDQNELYSFFAPLTSRMWLRRGFCPLLLLVGTPGAWLSSSRGRLVVEESCRSGAVVHFVGDFPGYKTATVAQIARLYASSAPGVREDDYFLTSDIDMWPLGNWVGSAGVDDGDVHLYHSDAYKGQSEPQQPMCYVGAKASAWIRLFDEQSSLHNMIMLGLRAFDYVKASWSIEEAKERAWDFDERLIGRAVAVFDGDVRRSPRLMTTPGQWRLDRSNWKIPEALNGYYADAHLPRPGFGDGWEKIRPLLALLGDFNLDWADNYHRAWLAAGR